MPTAFGGGCRAEHDGGWGTMSTMTTPSRKARHPSAEGNLAFVSLRNKFPSIGGVTRSVGVVRDYKKPHLLPIVIASKAWRSSK